MKGARIVEFPIRHLEYAFSPPGLALPAKGEGPQGTTSLLVRGGAGVGKTTFALALAHVIAKEGQGLVLYLTTEFSPVEIVYKATLLGLTEDVVEAWPGTEGMSAGGVVVEHLSVLREGRPVLSSEERRRGAIDAVWELLHPEKSDGARPPLPIRAVVIDALTLPEEGEREGALRADLVAFVQALESEGISVVLVEELAPGAPAWSSFVVDVVFELSFQPDAETHELRRKLTVLKCRYAHSIPGPHDYGLENGVPAVWPDLFRVMTGGIENPRSLGVEPLRLWIPLVPEEHWAPLGPSIILSPYDLTGAKAIRAIAHTPGVAMMQVNCGALTRVGAPLHAMSVYDNEGVHAIGWSILWVAKRIGANVCYMEGLDGLLSRSGWTTAVIHLLEGLRLAGFLVCIHSPVDAMKPLHAVADLIWGGAKYRAFPRPRRHYRTAARRCLPMPWFEGRDPIAALSQIEQAMDLETLRSAVETPRPPGLQAAALQERVGAKEAIAQILALTYSPDAGRERQQAAWLALHIGADWHAARVALESIETDKPEPSMHLLWKAICAVTAGNRAAIDDLKTALLSDNDPRVLDPLLRSLAQTDQFDEVDRVIVEVGTRHSLAPWMLARLHAEARMDARTPEVHREALKMLTALTADETLPLVHRAEIFYNIGLLHERLGDRAASAAAFQKASSLNPFLDVTGEGRSAAVSST